mgnify:FL=1|jgi:HEAT repeat protein
MFLHEVKVSAKGRNEARIVSAFGASMCPKLVREVMSHNRPVRVNALLALCEELQNPASLVGCVDLGIVSVLNAQVSADQDPLTRLRAAKALEICSRNATGVHALLQCNTAQMIVSALSDDEIEVREYVYRALIEFSTGNLSCVHALVAADYPAILINQLRTAKEKTVLQPLALRLLHNCLYSGCGLESALGHSAVETCIELLASIDTEVRREAASTLIALCLADVAKMLAIECGAIEIIIELLKDSDRLVRSAAAGALMTITTADEGKQAIISLDKIKKKNSVSLLAELLNEKDDILTTNTLKCIANIAVHPKAREILKNKTKFIDRLTTLCICDNAAIGKNARIVKKAIFLCPKEAL